jgi:hypothetical protein
MPFSLCLTSHVNNILTHDQTSTMKTGIATTLILILLTATLELSQSSEVSSEAVADIVSQLPSPSSALLTSFCGAVFFRFGNFRLLFKNGTSQAQVFHMATYHLT